MANRQDSDLYSCTMIKYRRDVISTLESCLVLKRLITNTLRYRKLNTRAETYGNGLQTSPLALLLVRLPTRRRLPSCSLRGPFPRFAYRSVRSCTVKSDLQSDAYVKVVGLLDDLGRKRGSRRTRCRSSCDIISPFRTMISRSLRSRTPFVVRYPRDITCLLVADPSLSTRVIFVLCIVS
jgi:hypothetical protein